MLPLQLFNHTLYVYLITLWLSWYTWSDCIWTQPLSYS